MRHVHLTYDNLMGSYVWKGKKDQFNVVMIGLAKELSGNDEQNELHHLLGALLSKELTIDEKLNIIGNEYDIPVRISTMFFQCLNLILFLDSKQAHLRRT